MRIVYRAENLIDAHLIKNVLEQQGIPAYVAGEYLTGAIGELPIQGLINVMVSEDQWSAARNIVEEIDARLAQARPLATKSKFGDGTLPEPA